MGEEKLYDYIQKILLIAPIEMNGTVLDWHNHVNKRSFRYIEEGVLESILRVWTHIYPESYFIREGKKYKKIR